MSEVWDLAAISSFIPGGTMYASLLTLYASPVCNNINRTTNIIATNIKSNCCDDMIVCKKMVSQLNTKKCSIVNTETYYFIQYYITKTKESSII